MVFYVVFDIGNSCATRIGSRKDNPDAITWTALLCVLAFLFPSPPFCFCPAMPYFRFTLVYEGGFASRLISGHGNLIVEPQIREVFLSDLRALAVRMPAATDRIRIYEAGSISLDFSYDPNEKGVSIFKILILNFTDLAGMVAIRS
jgi:hypothetical protein